MTKQNQNQQTRKIELDLHDLESVSGGTRKAGKGQQEFLVIKMSDVVITSVSENDASGGDQTEIVTLAFAKVDVEYRPQKPDGSLTAGVHFKYDLKSNKVG